MAGLSKRYKVELFEGVIDAKPGKIFTKLSGKITVVAKFSDGSSLLRTAAHPGCGPVSGVYPIFDVADEVLAKVSVA